MKVLRQSENRLTLRLSRNGVQAGICDLDRSRGGTVIRLAVAVPYVWRRFSVSDIREVTVTRRERQRFYAPILKLKNGTAISMGRYTKEDALKAAQAIREFLDSNHRSLGARIEGEGPGRERDYFPR